MRACNHRRMAEATVQIVLRVPIDVSKALRRLAAKEERSMNATAVLLLRDGIKRGASK